MSHFCPIYSLLSPIQLKSWTQSQLVLGMMKKLLKMPKQVAKVTVVVMVMHIYGNTKSNLPYTSAKNSAKMTKFVSKLKKLGLI